MIFFIIIILVLIILIYGFIVYNSLIKLDNKVNEAFATMDVYLKKRWDLVPNLVETVKGYSKHEKDTLEQILKIRNSVYDNISNDNKIKTNEALTSNIARIMLLAESYPELKADEHFLELSKELTNVENEIAQARKYYNAVVRLFNNKVEMFPSNLIAGITGYKPKLMFEATSSERNNVKVEL